MEPEHLSQGNAKRGAMVMEFLLQRPLGPCLLKQAPRHPRRQSLRCHCGASALGAEAAAWAVDAPA
jgi:hypothetical protein